MNKTHPPTSNLSHEIAFDVLLVGAGRVLFMINCTINITSIKRRFYSGVPPE